jgi:hypothetical protein
MGLLSLIAKLGLDISGFNTGLKQAEASAGGFGKRVGASLKSQLGGAFSVGAAVSIARTIAETASRAQDLAEQFDISTDAVQRIDFALKQGGLTFEDFGKAMDKFGAMRKRAADGDEEAAATLKQFGITLDEVKNPLQDNLELIEKMVVALKGIKITPAQRAELKEMFGARGLRMIAALQGAGANAPFQAAPEDIKRVEGADDAISAAWQAAKNAAVRVTANLLKNPWALLTHGGIVSAVGSLWNKTDSGGDTYSEADLAAMQGKPPSDGLNILDAGAGFNDLFRKPKKPETYRNTQTDALANVGGFVGGAGGGGGGATDLLKQSLRVQTASRDHLRDLNQNKATFGV